MRRLYPFVVGLLFGVVQTGYFFQLNFALASTYGTFLLVTLAWLTGSIIGLRASRVSFLTLHRGPWICLLPYFVTMLLLNAFPFQSNLWPLYGLLILISGIFSGLFFARLGDIIRPVRRLFFVENNGFFLGIVACTMAYLLLGRVVLWILPLALAALCWIWTPSTIQQSHSTETPSVETVEVPATTPDR
jgi:hypothetical protein